MHSRPGPTATLIPMGLDNLVMPVSLIRTSDRKMMSVFFIIFLRTRAETILPMAWSIAVTMPAENRNMWASVQTHILLPKG